MARLVSRRYVWQLSLFLVGAFFWISSALARPLVPAERAREFAGRRVTVEGTVRATRSEGRNTFLALGSDSTPELTVALTPPLLLSGFPDHPEEFYQDKTIQVNGVIYLFQGQPEMLVKNADRIAVVSERKTQAAFVEAEGSNESQSTVASAASSLPPILPRELLSGRETTVLDLRSAESAVEETQLAASPLDACREAQALWGQVTQDLLPHLRAYTACLEKGSLGCDPEGEKVALGMLGVQQAQKRVRVSCR